MYWLLLLDIIWNPQKDASRTCMFSVHLYLYVKYLNYIFNKCQSVLYVKQSWFLCQKYKPVILCLSIVQTIHSVLGFQRVSAVVVNYYYLSLFSTCEAYEFHSNWLKLDSMIQLLSVILFMSNYKRILVASFRFPFSISTSLQFEPFCSTLSNWYRTCPHSPWLLLSLSLCLWLSLLLLFVIFGRLAWGNNQYKVECGDLCVNVKTSQKCCQQLNWIGLR